MGNPLPAIVPPGPDNPLGAFVLKLDMPGYLIHGTNQPYGVGMRVSHGCVRLYPENIEFLFPEVAIGAAVTIVNEPFLLGERDGELYFEAHAPLEDDTVDPGLRLSAAIEQFADTYRVRLPQRATQHIEAITSYGHGVPVRVYAYDEAEYLARAVDVDNTVIADPDAPTLDEVRDMIDEVMAADEEPAVDIAGSAGLEGGIE
jgi:L,D-transpeptidase ErfK/SrfK